MFLGQKQIHRNGQSKKYGFTLIEALVFLFIFSVITTSFYKSWALATQAIIDSKKKAGAVALANEMMESIRNMSYDKIGIKEGDVPGKIEAERIVFRSGTEYRILTDAIAVDDDFDGIFPSDPNPIDYKKIKVTAFWGIDGARSASLVSTFTPPGIEDVFTGGILKLKIIDNEGNPIPQVWVRIKNNAINPVLDAFERTGLTGEIWLYQSDPSQETYEITVAPDGKNEGNYFQVMTHARSALFDPEDIHGSVIGGVINSKTIRTDKMSSIELYAKDPQGNPVANIVFDLSGGKNKGYDASISKEVYYFEKNDLKMDSNGAIELEGMSFGSYFFTFKDDPSSFRFLWLEPSVNTADKFDLLPDTSMNVTAVFADKRIASILVKVVDEDGSPIENSQVEISDGGQGNFSADTNRYGYAYFPSSGTLADASHTVTARKDGAEESAVVEAGNNLSEITIQL